MPPDLRVRPAVLADLPILRALIDASVRRLQVNDYTPAQREGALTTVFGVDTQLIADGTYLVVEYCPPESQAHTLIVACGGWSKRKTLYGADQWTDRHDDLLDPRHDAAKIRAFFIHPQHARKGVARAILQTCEAEAKASGFQVLELMSTLPGIKLYRACGYQGDDRVELDVGPCVSIGLVPMRKELT